MPHQTLLITQKGRIQIITINREAKLNALNKETLTELHEALTAAFADEATGGLIITGAGTKAFVAGADIAEFKDFDVDAAHDLSKGNQERVFNLIANSAKPVIAAINGFALGGGLELAMACHIRIASENAKMGLPEVTLGLIPGYGGTQRLTALVGKGKALELIMTADMVTAADAHAIGLVNHVVPLENLLEKAEEILTKILSRAPLAIAAAIKTVNASDTPAGYEIEIEQFANCFGTGDFKEGVDAFINKRKANFTGK